MVGKSASQAGIVMACIGMAHIPVAHIVMAHIVMAYTAMAHMAMPATRVGPVAGESASHPTNGLGRPWPASYSSAADWPV